MHSSNFLVFIYLFLGLTNCSTFKVALGSCSLQNKGDNITIFNAIIKDRPNYFVHLGDIVYLDKSGPSQLDWSPDQNPLSIRKRYQKMSQSAEYKALQLNGIEFKSVWDDHDSNLNNGDSSNPMLKVCLPIYKQEFKVTNATFNDALFQFYQIHPLVKLVLLDSRSYRTKQSMFNENVWIWLQNIFSQANENELILLGCGIQIIYDDRYTEQRWMPADRLRLYKLLAKYSVHVIFLSGDVHFGEIGYRYVHQITSSGLSFSITSNILYADTLVKKFYPTTYSRSSDRFTLINYGLITLNVDDRRQQIKDVKLEIKDINGKTAVIKKFKFDKTLIDSSFKDTDIGTTHLNLKVYNTLIQVFKSPSVLFKGLTGAIASGIFAVFGKSFAQIPRK